MVLSSLHYTSEFFKKLKLLELLWQAQFQLLEKLTSCRYLLHTLSRPIHYVLSRVMKHVRFFFWICHVVAKRTFGHLYSA